MHYGAYWHCLYRIPVQSLNNRLPQLPHRFTLHPLRLDNLYCCDIIIVRTGCADSWCPISPLAHIDIRHIAYWHSLYRIPVYSIVPIGMRHTQCQDAPHPPLGILLTYHNHWFITSLKYSLFSKTKILIFFLRFPYSIIDLALLK